MACIGWADDVLGAVAILAQLIDPHPPLDQPQNISAGSMGLQHDAGQVDEPTDRGLDVAAAAALELLALALRRAVSSAERTVEHLDRVIGRPLKRLDAERHQHRTAPLGNHPRERLIGLLAPGLRQPRLPVRRPDP